MQYLKQSTPVVIKFGPVLDFEDGVTLENGAAIITALDHPSTGIMISKNGGTLAVRHADVTPTTYDAHGFYNVSLDAIDTNTLGRLLVCHTKPDTYLAVWKEYMVMPANIYDSMFGSDKFDVDLADVFLALNAIPTNPLLTTDSRVDNIVGALDAIPINPLLANDSRVDGIISAIGAIPTNPLLDSDSRLDYSFQVLPVMQGQVYTATAIQDREVIIVQGDTPRITFDLGANYAGWTPRFAAKDSLTDDSYFIAPKECTWTTATGGMGYVELTASETALRGKYHAEIELSQGAQRLTAMRFTLKIIAAIIKE